MCPSGPVSFLRQCCVMCFMVNRGAERSYTWLPYCLLAVAMIARLTSIHACGTERPQA